MTFIAIMTVFAFIAILFNTLFTLAMDKKMLDDIENVRFHVSLLATRTRELAQNTKELVKSAKDLEEYIALRKDD